MVKIAICDDEEKSVALHERMVRECLQAAGIGCEITTYTQSRNLLYDITDDAFFYDLILLDLMLPGRSGYEVCRRIRDQVDVPILMVTARTDSVDKIRGLGLGADDYIAKPFDPAELVARVKSHLSRYQRLTGGRGEDDGAIQVGDLRILPQSWKVFKGNQEIKMPNREFALLKFLAENPNIVFSKERLFETIWGYDYVGDSATVTVHVGRIRDKIENDPAHPKIIETVWGAGYRLNRS